MSFIYWIYSEIKEVREDFIRSLLKTLGFSKKEIFWIESSDPRMENITEIATDWSWLYKKELNKSLDWKKLLVIAGTNDWWPEDFTVYEYFYKSWFEAVWFLTAWNPNLIYLSDKLGRGKFLDCLEVLFSLELAASFSALI